MFVSVDEDGRICATTEFEEYRSDDMFEFEFPADFNFDDQGDYRILDGVLTYEPVEMSPEGQIAVLKNNLKETDYIVLKVAEYKETGREFPPDEAERYAEIIPKRQEWRDEINRLESLLEES